MFKLSPSPERLGLRGTEAWWRTTIKTLVGTTAVLLATGVVLWQLTDAVEAGPPKGDTVGSTCASLDQQRADATINGTVNQPSPLVTGKQLEPVTC